MNGLGRNKEEKQNKSIIFTKETLGVVMVLFATLSLICLITGDTLFSTPGMAVSNFLFGCFGFFAYAVVVWLIAWGVLLIASKKTGLSVKRKVLFTIAFFVIALISQIATINNGAYSFGEYLSATYQMGAGGVKGVSGGGVITALVAYPLFSLLTAVGCYVVLGVVLAGVCYAIVDDFIRKPKRQVKKFRSSYVKEQNQNLPQGVVLSGEKDYPVEGANIPQDTPKQSLFVNNPNDFAFKSKREMNKEQNTTGMKIGFSAGGLGVVTSSQPQAQPQKPKLDDYNQKIDYIKTPPQTIDVNAFLSNNKPTQNQGVYRPREEAVAPSVSQYVNQAPVEKEEKKEEEIPFIEHEQTPVTPVVKERGDSASARAELFNSIYLNADEPEVDMVPEKEEQEIYRPIEEEKIEEVKEEICIKEENDQPQEEGEEEIFPPVINARRVREIFTEETPVVEDKPVIEEGIEKISRRQSLFEKKEVVKEEKVQPIEEKPEKEVEPINRKYYAPSFDLLEIRTSPVNAGQENHQERMEIIQKTLEDFHINAVPQSYVQGPAITRYEIMMPAGISVKKVLNYDDDLKMRLSAKDGVRIEAPIPGKNLVGIEVANDVKVTVGFREVMEGLAEKPKKGSLVFAVGKDIVGNCISYDLSKGPHYLIAGATGSGKSVCLHVMLASLLMRYSPEDLKLVLVDPKSVEFRKYEHIPHLLVDEIITEPKRAIALLQWAYSETNRRNELFTECGGMVSNIDDYNSLIANDTIQKLPRIVFVIDELADLMENCKKDLEQRIRMIAAKSRSAGIHLVLATQRPSVDVITGTIKANLPSRIALKVMNYADSQTILGEIGAEKLLGYGDMLYKDSSMGNYERYQGAYISGAEVTNLVNYIKEKNKSYFNSEVKEYLDNETRPKQEEPTSDENGGANNGDAENDVLFLKALWFAVTTEQVSISALQRRYRVGYGRAGHIVDQMERLGYVAPNEGSKGRRVLLSKQDFIEKYGEMSDDDLF